MGASGDGHATKGGLDRAMIRCLTNAELPPTTPTTIQSGRVTQGALHKPLGYLGVERSSGQDAKRC